MKLDKIWHRGIIKFLNKKRLAPKDIHADMVATLGVTVPSYAIVKRWAAHFKMDKEGLEHDGRCGKPTKATTEEIAAHVYSVVMDDRRLTVNQIANTIGIFQRVENILHMCV